MYKWVFGVCVYVCGRVIVRVHTPVRRACTCVCVCVGVGVCVYVCVCLGGGVFVYVGLPCLAHTSFIAATMSSTDEMQ